MSKILKLPKNNITIGIEDSVEFLPNKFYKGDFETLQDSVTKIKQKARSKCSYSFCPTFFSFSFICFFISSFLSCSSFIYFFSFIFFFLPPSLFFMSFFIPILFFVGSSACAANHYVIAIDINITR